MNSPLVYKKCIFGPPAIKKCIYCKNPHKKNKCCNESTKKSFTRDVKVINIASLSKVLVTVHKKYPSVMAQIQEYIATPKETGDKMHEVLVRPETISKILYACEYPQSIRDNPTCLCITSSILGIKMYIYINVKLKKGNVSFFLDKKAVPKNVQVWLTHKKAINHIQRIPITSGNFSVKIPLRMEKHVALSTPFIVEIFVEYFTKKDKDKRISYNCMEDAMLDSCYVYYIFKNDMAEFTALGKIPKKVMIAYESYKERKGNNLEFMTSKNVTFTNSVVQRFRGKITEDLEDKDKTKYLNYILEYTHNPFVERVQKALSDQKNPYLCFRCLDCTKDKRKGIQLAADTPLKAFKPQELKCSDDYIYYTFFEADKLLGMKKKKQKMCVAFKIRDKKKLIKKIFCTSDTSHIKSALYENLLLSSSPEFKSDTPSFSQKKSTCYFWAPLVMIGIGIGMAANFYLPTRIGIL